MNRSTIRSVDSSGRTLLAKTRSAMNPVVSMIVQYTSASIFSSDGAAYRYLRTVEHRLQLYQLRRTHTMPDDEAAS